MRARSYHCLYLALSIFCATCKNDESVAPPPPSSPPRCTCEASEDCSACFAHIGECCYDDVTIGGRVALLVANCERDGRCSSCCNECVVKSCEQLRADHDCPFQVP